MTEQSAAHESPEDLSQYASYPRLDDRGQLGKFRELRIAYTLTNQSGLALLATLVVYLLMVSFKTSDIIRNVEILLLGTCILTFVNCFLKSVVAAAKTLDQSIPGNFLFALIVLFVPFAPLVVLISNQKQLRARLGEFGLTPTMTGFDKNKVEEMERRHAFKTWPKSD